MFQSRGKNVNLIYKLQNPIVCYLYQSKENVELDSKFKNLLRGTENRAC